MALFLIERAFADALKIDSESVKALGKVNAEVGVKWLYSFLAADKRKTYCLYEAETPELIREAARRAGLPCDSIIELAGELRPEAFASA